MDKKNNAPTENGIIALTYLRGITVPATAAEVASNTGLNPKGVGGVLTSLVKKNLAEKGEPATLVVEDKKGLKGERQYQTYIITEAGIAAL